jgi:hypothetical protein
VQLEGLGQMKESCDIIRNRTHNPPACSIVPQPTTLPRAPVLSVTNHITNICRSLSLSLSLCLCVCARAYPRPTIHGPVHVKVCVDWAAVFKSYQMFICSSSRASKLSSFLHKETQDSVKVSKLSYDSGPYNHWENKRMNFIPY